MSVTPVWTRTDPFSAVFGASAPSEHVNMYRDYYDALLERRKRNAEAVKREYEASQAMPSPLDRRPEVRGAVSDVKFDEMLADGAIE